MSRARASRRIFGRRTRRRSRTCGGRTSSDRMKRSRSYRADMLSADTLRVGITCYPSVGGSGVLATALGEDLAARGHDVHFIAYERPFRLPSDAPRLHFHPVAINEYELFRFPDYTLPLSVRMAEVSRDHRLAVLHVHYAVPPATAAILARAMLPPGQQPRVVTTLPGTDTTFL